MDNPIIFECRPGVGIIDPHQQLYLLRYVRGLETGAAIDDPIFEFLPDGMSRFDFGTMEQIVTSQVKALESAPHLVHTPLTGDHMRYLHTRHTLLRAELVKRLSVDRLYWMDWFIQRQLSGLRLWMSKAKVLMISDPNTLKLAEFYIRLRVSNKLKAERTPQIVQLLGEATVVRIDALAAMRAAGVHVNSAKALPHLTGDNLKAAQAYLRHRTQFLKDKKAERGQ